MPRSNIVTRGARLLGRDPTAFFERLYRMSYRYTTDALGDMRYGVSTGLWRSTDGNEALQRRGYEPIPYGTLGDVARHMRAKGIPTKTFVDIGCGYGRPLYYFADRFDELIGYEIDPVITRAAIDQLEKAQGRREAFRKISIVSEDATAALPIDRDLVIFFYHSFGPEPIRRLVDRMKQSRHRIDFYYPNPGHVKLFEELLGLPSEEFSSFMKVRYLHRPAG